MKGNLGYWGRDGQTKGVNKPPGEPWEGNAEKRCGNNDISSRAVQAIVLGAGTRQVGHHVCLV